MNYCDSAVVFVAREPGSDSQPLLLQNLLFSPAAAWLCRSLQLSGVERFFVVTEREFLDACAACFPQTAHILPYDHPQLNDALQAFVSVAEGKVLTFTQPVWLSFAAGQELAQAETLLPAGVPLGIYRVEPEALARDGIDAAFQGEPYAPALDAAPIALPFHTPAERNQAQYCARMDNLCRWLSLGVEMLDMNAVYIDIDAEIGSGTVLLPGTILRGHTAIAAGCEIGPNAMVRDCIVGKDTTINASQVNESTIGSHTTVGPFTYVRPNCRIGDHCRVGDFVEVKNSVIGDGTKISHLTYVGDSDVGRRVNFGCGTVTTNYDGLKKFRCTIGDDAFLGCNTNLIAPVTVGDRAYTAAGSTVTDNVPNGALAIARARQTNKEGWAEPRLAAYVKKQQKKMR